MKKFRLFWLVAMLCCMACEKDFLPPPGDVIEIEQFSNEVNDTYLLRIHLPDSYNESDSSYPVLFQLDGETTTGSVIENYENLVESDQIQELIIVSIDYVGENQRERDFTPTEDERNQLDDYPDPSGEADTFLNYLRHELIPFIDQKYRTDLAFGHTLRGYSEGGLFASVAMFRSIEEGSVFSNFIIESPYWYWDDNFIFLLEDEYASNNSDLAVTAYFAVGEIESIIKRGPFELMEERILNRNYPNFNSTFEYLENQSTYDAKENTKGLIEIFGI